MIARQKTPKYPATSLGPNAEAILLGRDYVLLRSKKGGEEGVSSIFIRSDLLRTLEGSTGISWDVVGCASVTVTDRGVSWNTDSKSGYPMSMFFDSNLFRRRVTELLG